MKYMILALTALSAMVSPVAAQTAPSRPEIPPPASNHVLSTVPADISSGVPVVDVMVNGKGPFRFFVDTGGTGYAHLTPATVTKIGLTDSPGGQVVNGQSAPRYAVKEIKIGNTRFTDFEVLASIPQAVADSRGIEGMIGMHLLQDYVLVLDYAAGKVSLSDKPLQPGPGVVPITREDGFINVMTKIGDRTVRLHVDSGNRTAALAVPEDLAKALVPTTTSPRVIGQARSMGKSFEIKAFPLAAPVALGDFILDVPEVTFPSPAAVGNIGAKAFIGVVLEIDQKNNLLRITRPGDRPAAD